MKTRQQPFHRASGNDARRARTAGFALVEVMVAVLLFAIGILGIVGLQASMMQAQTDSKVRADAANLVDEVATLMWSELSRGKPLPASINNVVQFKAAACAGDVTCNGWLTKVQSTLPGGTLSDLSFDETNTNAADPAFGLVSVKLTWTLPNSTVAHSYSATFNLAPASL